MSRVIQAASLIAVFRRFGDGLPVTPRFPDFEKERPSCEGKIIVVTGCTTGTGLVAAKTCAKKGAHVVMLNRASHLDATLVRVFMVAQSVGGKDRHSSYALKRS